MKIKPILSIFLISVFTISTAYAEKPVAISIKENSFELILRILGNEFVAIKIGSTNFSGKLIAGGVLLLFFTFVIMELFGLHDLLKG